MEVFGQRNGRSFKDSVEKSSAEANEVFCQPCSSEEDWLVAVGYCQNCNEYFCASCLKPHHKQSATRHHVTLEGKDMPRPQMSQIQLDPCSEPCVQHENEIVKFYCSTHDAVGCSDCMVLNHKTCKVDRIQDVSSKYFQSQEHKELVGKVEKFVNDLDKIKHQVQRIEQLVNESCNKAVNDIKAFRKEVNDYLDKAEIELLTEVNKRKQREEKMMAKLKEDKQLLQNDIKELEKKLDQQSNKANVLFVAAKNMKKRMSPLDATLKQMFQNSQVKEFQFEPSPKVRENIASQVPFGKLTENIDCQSQKIEYMVPQYYSEINVRAPEETMFCFLIASAIISPNQIVLVDYNNQSLKLVDIQQKKLVSRLSFKNCPTDVARVNENTVAVTVPDEQKIQFLSITQDNKFTMEREMNVNCDCEKLFYEKDKIIIAVEGKIVILNTSGKVVKEITFQDLGFPPCIVPANDSKSFYVSTIGSPFSSELTAAVYRFKYDGTVVAMYKDKNLPDARGLTVTKDGTVLICNQSVPGGIYVMTPECEDIKEILQDNEHVIMPCCVSLCGETNRLFLCNYSGLIRFDNLCDYLKIFLMKSY